jgi:hypothetical protein
MFGLGTKGSSTEQGHWSICTDGQYNYYLIRSADIGRNHKGRDPHKISAE